MTRREIIAVCVGAILMAALIGAMAFVALPFDRPTPLVPGKMLAEKELT